MNPSRRRRDENGTISLELALLTPVLLFGLLQLIVFAGRASSARSDVVSAAGDGARAASLQRSLGAAHSAATEAVNGTLTAEGVGCRGEAEVHTGVQPGAADTTSFEGGNYVLVEVVCEVDLDDLFFLDLPMSRTFREEAVEVIDVHRSAS